MTLRSAAAVFAVLSSAVCVAATPATKRPVDVRTSASDKTTDAFADAVRAALPMGARVRVQTPEEDDDLSLVLADVVPDGRKFAWSADLLKVNAGFTPTRVGAFSGKCRTDALAACAKEVVADADRAVRKVEKD